MNEHEVESQLSAMFDGELPAAECELLSRRIDRDENLRSRWSRYALIGAAMRSEPVATARSGFALRVSAALAADLAPKRAARGRSLVWNTALAATLVAAVAGLSVSMLRDAALGTGTQHAVGALAGASSAPVTDSTLLASEPAAAALPVLNSAPSYVTPAGSSGAATILRTQLADYIVAHSAYSTPLLRRNVLSELITSEDAMGIVSSHTIAAGSDATRSASGSSR
ncbi:MAG TPA: sigma-E factor negative regulatory protein [Steroidobacteraceae bacterium]